MVYAESKSTYQEESIGKESISKHKPANPAASSPSWGQDFRQYQRDNNPDEFVARVRDEIQKLRVIVDAEDIHGQFQAENLKHDHRNGRRCRRAKEFGMEVATEACQHRGEEDIRD